MGYGKKQIDSIDADAVDFRETDPLTCVMACKSSIGRKTPLALFRNFFARDFIKNLDPKYTPPHRLDHIRVTKVMIDGAFMEFHCIKV